MRAVLVPLTVLVGLGLIAGPAGATPLVELAPPTSIISVEGGVALNANGKPLSPAAIEYFSPDNKNGSEDEETDQTCPVIGRAERAFTDKINRARARRDKRPVYLDRQISAVAAMHSRAMKRQAELYHTRENNLRERVTRWELLGENVGRGMDPDSLHRAFMGSRGHRRIIIDKRFRYAGVGIVRDNDQVWITVLFESDLNPGTTVRMPEGC